MSDASAPAATDADPSTLELCAARLAHEMRNPLHAIMGFAQLLTDAERMAARPDLLVQHARTIDRVARELHDSVDDLIGVFSRNPLKPPEAAQEVALTPLVDTAAAGLASALSCRHQELRRRLDVDVAYARPRGLCRALSCLISNAARHGPTGGTIDVLAHREPDGVAIGVRDSGPGMTTADIVEALKPFTRLAGDPATDESGGIGLGLPICRIIAEQHGGRLDIESRPGEGTTAWLRLPAAPV